MHSDRPEVCYFNPEIGLCRIILIWLFSTHVPDPMVTPAVTPIAEASVFLAFRVQWMHRTRYLSSNMPIFGVPLERCEEKLVVHNELLQYLPDSNTSFLPHENLSNNCLQHTIWHETKTAFTPFSTAYCQSQPSHHHCHHKKETMDGDRTRIAWWRHATFSLIVKAHSNGKLFYMLG